MPQAVTIEVGDHGVVNEGSVLTGIEQALAVAAGVNYSLSLLREDTSSLRLLRVVATLTVTLGSQALQSLGRMLARVQGVAYVSGPGFFFTGPAFGRSLVTTTSDQIRGLQTQMTAVVGQLNLLAKQIQFIGEPFTATGVLTATVPVEISDADGKRVGLYPPTNVTVRIAGGTAPGPTLTWNGQADVAGDLVVTVTGGRALVTVAATAIGTVDLVLVDSAATGLSVVDTATVTFAP